MTHCTPALKTSTPIVVMLAGSNHFQTSVAPLWVATFLSKEEAARRAAYRRS
ncbi:MAG TPA: hypothetical protein VJK50_03230 [Patescibacteria group bacterium]|nr:hypothetical protein [Patescibacteria group bacterium]